MILTKKDYFKIALFAIGACFLWGTNYPALKYATTEMPVFMMHTLRLTLTAFMLLPFLRFKRKYIMRLFAYSLSQYTINSGFNSLGTSLTNGSTGALVTQLAIPFGFLLSWVHFKERPKLKHIIGSLVSFIGLYILIYTTDKSTNFLGIVVLGTGALLSALANIQVKSLKHLNLLTVMATSTFLAIPQALFISLFTEKDGLTRMLAASQTCYWAVAYIVTSSFTANFLWNRIIREYPISYVMPYGLLVPLFGIFCSVIALKEQLNITMIIGGCTMLCGIAILNFTKINFKISNRLKDINR